jgi:outer membrane cobalamin receptor
VNPARLLVLLVGIPGVAHAQGAGSESPQTLGTVVVAAERAPTSINRSMAAVTRLTAADLARLPTATLADVLRRVPGFAVVDFDGLGKDPQLMVRGFYGGGEAEYVVVMVDGRPVNQVHNGTITWETLPPLASIESIEIVRGSASALHGDAAVAGVINIVTRRSSSAATRWRLGGESFQGLSASTDVSNSLFNRDVSFSAAFDRTGGFRDHASRSAASTRASMRVSRVLRTSLEASWRDFDEPGPLLQSLAQTGSETDPRFAGDGGDDRQLSATVEHNGWLGAGGTLNTTVRAGGRRATLVRTLPLSPDFGDTRERELRTFALGATTQADLTPTILPPGFDRVSFGAAADLGTIDSRYYSYDQSGIRGEDALGDGRRAALAAFLHLAATPVERIRWTFGVRADLLFDRFEPVVDPPAVPRDFSESHFAFSPKMGVNVRYAESGNAWVSASRTFKAPTLDQLFDQRPVPVPFPPDELTTSNPELEPQRGTSIEAGVYHDLSLATARVGLTGTVYQIDMKDELDFDVQSLKYVNIARSRHRGTELGVTVRRGIVSGHASVSLQDVVSRAGMNSGKRLKAVPGHVLAGGLTFAPEMLGSASLALTRTADMYIDDANSQRIPAWTRVDIQFSRPVGSFEITAGARNLLDERYNSTAFLDPSGSGQAYVYPAAGRVFTIGLRYGR